MFLAFPSSSTMSPVRYLSPTKVIADHPSAVCPLVHMQIIIRDYITRLVVDTGMSQTERPYNVHFGYVGVVFFRSTAYLTDNSSQTKPHQRLPLVCISSSWRLSSASTDRRTRLPLSSVATSLTSSPKTSLRPQTRMGRRAGLRI